MADARGVLLEEDGCLFFVGLLDFALVGLALRRREADVLRVDRVRPPFLERAIFFFGLANRRDYFN
jgi:hypothetical protein